MQLAKRHLIQLGKPVLAGWLIALVLMLNAMAASPALHELIHKDADKADHDCAITMFAHGHVDSVTGDISVAEPPPAIEFVPCFVSFLFSTTVFDLPSGRAPPLLA